jgi:hypothetical protein
MNRDIVALVKAPRALHVRFPFGAPLGPAHAPELQMAVVREALDLLAGASVPGEIVESRAEWPG